MLKRAIVDIDQHVHDMVGKHLAELAPALHAAVPLTPDETAATDSIATAYDLQHQRDVASQLISSLTPAQRAAFDTIQAEIQTRKRGAHAFFLDGLMCGHTGC